MGVCKFSDKRSVRASTWLRGCFKFSETSPLKWPVKVEIMVIHWDSRTLSLWLHYFILSKILWVPHWMISTVWPASLECAANMPRMLYRCVSSLVVKCFKDSICCNSCMTKVSKSWLMKYSERQFFSTKLQSNYALIFDTTSSYDPIALSEQSLSRRLVRNSWSFSKKWLAPTATLR